MAKPIYVLNGPNLNLLGSREPEVYGKESLEDVRAKCEQKAAALGLSVVPHLVTREIAGAESVLPQAFAEVEHTAYADIRQDLRQ